jgi:hypothetical protein
MNERGEIRSVSEIPTAEFYVVMTDSFLSDWGRAEGRDAVFIWPTDSASEAEAVADNARAREDQKRVRIQTTKPRPRPSWYLQVMNRGEASNWARPGYFADQAAKREKEEA